MNFNDDRVLGAPRLRSVRYVQIRLYSCRWNELQGVSDHLGRRRLGTTGQVSAYHLLSFVISEALLCLFAVFSFITGLF